MERKAGGRIGIDENETQAAAQGESQPCEKAAQGESQPRQAVAQGTDQQTQAEVQKAPALIPFSLSRSLGRVLPRALWSDAEGRLCPIDADFRTVLMCLRRLCDADLTALQRSLYLGRRFFKGHAPRDAGTMFTAFVTGGEPSSEEPPVMDFEVDAGALYASFRQQYQIDLLRDRLHWAEFRELVAGLGESTPFGARVCLRTLPDGHLAPETRAEVARARERIAIKPHVSKAEQALLQELERRLIAGEDPAEIIQRMQEG